MKRRTVTLGNALDIMAIDAITIEAQAARIKELEYKLLWARKAAKKLYEPRLGCLRSLAGRRCRRWKARMMSRRGLVPAGGIRSTNC